VSPRYLLSPPLTVSLKVVYEYSAPTRVISLENTLNGTIFPQSDILEIATFARKHDIKLHLDGARLWHVATETGTSLDELCRVFDSVSLCFSKGLGLSPTLSSPFVPSSNRSALPYVQAPQ